MSMVDRVCVHCHRLYTFYQEKNILKDCPYCGAKGGYLSPIRTTEEHNKMVGIMNYKITNIEVEDGYIHASTVVDGYALDTLFRIQDDANGAPLTLVSINYADKHPTISDDWDFIEQEFISLVSKETKEGIKNNEKN